MASLSPSLFARILINSCLRRRATSVLSLTNTLTGLLRDTAAKSFTCDKANSEVIKLFPCSAQLRLKFILLKNVKIKMPTVVGILTFISRINYRL